MGSLIQVLTLALILLLESKSTFSFYLPNKNVRSFSSFTISREQQRHGYEKSSIPMFLNSKTKSITKLQLKINKDKVVAYPQQTPHAECHFTPTINTLKKTNDKRKPKLKQGRRRFMEGWYYRITIPEEKVSFAIIMSIEDPGLSDSSNLTLAACQIMGPNDEYLIQGSKNDTRLWAFDDSQSLGCTFNFTHENDEDIIGPIHENFDNIVSSGFQILPNKLQGKIVGHDGCQSYTNQDIVDMKGNAGNCKFDINITPLVGWGGNKINQQRSTAGWLASYPVFEPHWQVTLADARATGYIEWKDKLYQFDNVPFYAEKNWGGTFPIKWYWVQCNSFDGYGDDNNNQLCLTSGGGIRELPLFKQKEEVGLIGIHYKNEFYEAVPWTGTMEWDIDPWGKWILKGKCTKGELKFESEVVAECKQPGVILRAPTQKDGLVYFCRDSFYANITLSLWPLEYDMNSNDWVRGKKPIIDCAKSCQAAVEIGGGPWWTSWKGTSYMKQPMRGLVRFPYLIQAIKRKLNKFRRFRR